MGPLLPFILPALGTLSSLSVPAALVGGAVGTLVAPTVGGILANPSKAWRTLTSSPIKGDAVLVEIYGADLFVKGDDLCGNQPVYRVPPRHRAGVASMAWRTTR